MWLLNVHTRELEPFQGSDTPSYAILSHRWNDDEPTFKDVQKRRCLDRKGYQKVDLCCKQATLHGYKYVWIDTCCIDKRSSAELSEAVNSMYNWYLNAAICYVYLSDVTTESDNWIRSQWFTRGWTLQELLAPRKVEFYDSSWNYLGNKNEDWLEIGRRTGIPSKALKLHFCPTNFSIAQRMSWAAGRITTRPEDRAYSLLGIFDVNMPLLYGEGERKAFYRLQEEIMKTSTDSSVFAWSRSPDPSFGMLAGSPGSFSLPWISRHVLNDSAKPELRPFVSDYIYSKAGISGTFSLRQHTFNVYVASIGDIVPSIWNSMETLPSSPSQDYPHVGIFLQYFPSDKQYHRIQFDGAYCIALDVEAYTRTKPINTKIQISRCPSRAETSNDLSLFACEKLSLSLSPRSMFSVGYLKLGNLPQPSDTSPPFVSNLVSNSFVPGPCIVLENKLYIHFAYDLRQKLAVFISSFEGNLVGFMMNRENLFSPSPPASIERLVTFNGPNEVSINGSAGDNTQPDRKRQRYNPVSGEMPSLKDYSRARHVVVGDAMLTIIPRSGSHRIWFDFEDKNVDISETPIPVSWYLPRSHYRNLVDVAVANGTFIDMSSESP